MKRLRKGSTAIFTVLALGLVLALPASAQTVQGEPVTQSYAVQAIQVPLDGEEPSDSSMAFTIQPKQGVDSEDVIITWKVDPRNGRNAQKDGSHPTAEYQVETAQRKGVTTQ